ncbi:MAG: hypothetical protein IPM51_00870 [Sphingobacteriaceae bacterium]|nr:hypothetical protein [Sphingobacteriaceae bacterium]
MNRVWNQYLTAMKSDWNAWRIIRLMIGLLLVIQTLYAGDYLLSAFGAYYMFLALTNTGCCGTSTCSSNSVSDEKEALVIYEEVK